MATKISIQELLNRVLGPRGINFPNPPGKDSGSMIAGGFTGQTEQTTDKSDMGTDVRKYDKKDLGSYVFLPAEIDGIDIENPVVIITGEKEVVETDVVSVGTVFEHVFTRPYSISIISTMIGESGEWPESKLRQFAKHYKKDDVTTLKCALTDVFLQADKNFVITGISQLDAQGAENCEIWQIDGKSNVDFELEIL